MTFLRLQLSSLCTHYDDRKHALSKWVWWSCSTFLFGKCLVRISAGTLYPETLRVFISLSKDRPQQYLNRPRPLNPNHFQFIFSSPITLPSPKLRIASTRILTIPGPPALPLNIIYTPLIFWPLSSATLTSTCSWLYSCQTSCPFFVVYVIPKHPSKSDAFWYIS